MRESIFVPKFAHLPEVVTVVAVKEVTNTFLQGIFWWYQKKVVSLQTISNHDFIEN
jgi:hypothetical protein